MAATMKSVCVMTYSDPTRDPRPNRMIRLLREHYNVTVVGLGDGQIDRVEFVPLPKRGLGQKVKTALRLLLRRYAALAWPDAFETLAQQLETRSFDVIVVHDISLLPLAARIKKEARILFDAREYYPKHFEDQLVWRLRFQPVINYLCARYLHLPDRMITVSDGIAREYERVFNVKSEVVMSLPDCVKLVPSKTEAQRVRMVHHGNATPSRQLESMIHLMDFVDRRFSLDLMLMGNPNGFYFKKLRKMAAQRSNVRIIPPMPFTSIVPFTNQYDIGVFLVPPTTFNLKYALPNKLFEFIQARLAVAIGPSVEMRKIVEGFDCGVVSPDFIPQSLAQMLNRLDASQIENYKYRSHVAAQILNSNESNRKLLEIIASLA